jgi:hypothetical protein
MMRVVPRGLQWIRPEPLDLRALRVDGPLFGKQHVPVSEMICCSILNAHTALFVLLDGNLPFAKKGAYRRFLLSIISQAVKTWFAAPFPADRMQYRRLAGCIQLSLARKKEHI